MDGYYTVSQYAEISGKDPGNIRRMLIKGTLKGEKAGNQWLIPKDAVYPDDRRVRSGKYRNYRQRMRLSSVHPDIFRKLCSLCEEIGGIYGENIGEVVLYGSYARGDESGESDIDLALMLPGEQTEALYDRTTERVIDYELDMGITISVVPINADDYTKWKAYLPFYKSIEKEGISLWKSK